MGKSLLRTDNELVDIYKRNVKTVYRVCYVYLKNPSDTEDAVSDTFVRFIKSAPALVSEEHEKAWLIRTAINVCKDFLKHWRRLSKDIEDYSEILKSEDCLENDGILKAVCALPDKYKSVIHLYYYEGYTSVQIAEILCKPKSTIRNYLHEARGLLKKKLGDFYEEQ